MINWTGSLTDTQHRGTQFVLPTLKKCRVLSYDSPFTIFVICFNNYILINNILTIVCYNLLQAIGQFFDIFWVSWILFSLENFSLPRRFAAIKKGNIRWLRFCFKQCHRMIYSQIWVAQMWLFSLARVLYSLKMRQRCTTCSQITIELSWHFNPTRALFFFVLLGGWGGIF